MSNLSYQTRNPRAAYNPLRSIPLFRSVASVFGPTPRQVVEIKLSSARIALPRAEASVKDACAALGPANRVRGSMRRFWQAKAFRLINQARQQLRAARKALVAVEMALLALDGDLFGAA